MFRHSSNLVITGGQFTEIGSNHDAVSTILLPHVAAGAIFDSAERYAAGRCHPGTRQRIIDRVKGWIQATKPKERILWMHGSAGAGKSSLMQSLCEILRDWDPDMKGASFFFARGHPNRGEGTKLFVTLAYQLAVQFPSVRAKINEALYRDPTLPTKSMDRQLRSLVIDPLLQCEDFGSPTPILFIDGLDECSTDDAQMANIQSKIITLISESLKDDKIPVRFMIASRPEYWIWDSFETSPLSDITVFLSLRDDFDTDKDIRTYLTENFEQIRLRKSRIMRSVPLPWPPRHIVNRFVEEASGQYIYASTVLKFVGDHPFKNPEDQLRIITTPGPHRATAYSDLDKLYATIASAYPGWDAMKRVLGGLLVGVNLATIQVLLNVPRAEIRLVLDALSSLIDVVPPAPLPEDDQLLIPIFGSTLEDENISFCHLSFREFLLDKARSGLYYVDDQAICGEVISAFFAVIQHNLDENYEIEPHISCDISLSEYRRMMKAIIQVVPSRSYDFRGLSRVLNVMVERFRRFDIDRSRRMKHPACFMWDMDVLRDFSSQLCKMRHNTAGVELATPSMVSCFAMANQIQNFASMARKIGIRLLSLCDGFSITVTLFLIHYLAHRKRRRHIRELLTIPGNTVADCESTIRKHRHIVSLTYDRARVNHLVSTSLVDLKESIADNWLHWPVGTDCGALLDLKATIGDGWLCRTECTNQHVLFVCKCLRFIMDNLDNDWEHLAALNVLGVHPNDSILANFFDNGDISDIRGEDYFKNDYHRSFLEVMVDSSPWIALFSSRPTRWWTFLDTIVNPVLGWFNRQLAHPTANRLMEEHDIFLPNKMTTAMECIFQHCFMPIFKTPYFSELLVSTFPLVGGGKSIRLKVLQSDLLEEDTAFIQSEGYSSFHVPIFLMGQGAPPPIPISQWYPHLAAYLLNFMVKDLYREIHPEFTLPGTLWNASPWSFEKFPSHHYTVQCLPYAQTTHQNLDALRAIKCLSQRVGSWLPQSGFGAAAREFLRRYDPSALSSDELSNFELWLKDVGKYDEQTEK